MTYLVFDTETEFDKAEAVMFDDLKARAQAAGHQIINGEIVPKRNGVDDLTAQRTVRWADKRTRETDRKYVMPSPDKARGGTSAEKTALKADVKRQAPSMTEADEQADWWPETAE